MNRYPGMNLVRGALLVVSLMAAACGGEKSVASKSAEAYREAQAKGIPAGGGHEHGGHSEASTTAAADHAHGTTSNAGSSIDHSAHGTTADAHAGMNHGAGVVDHAAMGHGTTDRPGAPDHAAMGHGTTASHSRRTPAVEVHTQHGADMATTPATSHDQHAGMQRAPTAPAADPHAQHRTTGTPRPAMVAAAPRSNAEMQRVQPSATLSRDAFDAPAPVSVAEATKAAQGGGHEGHQTRGITPGEDRENPPTPTPATRDGSSNAPAMDHSQQGTKAKPQAKPSAVTYTCPMHPEVTSDKPGTCPKCGMTLVKRK